MDGCMGYRPASGGREGGHAVPDVSWRVHARVPWTRPFCSKRRQKARPRALAAAGAAAGAARAESLDPAGYHLNEMEPPPTSSHVRQLVYRVSHRKEDSAKSRN